MERRRTCSGRSWAWGEWIAPRQPVCPPDGWFLGGNTAGLQARRTTADSSTRVHAPASTSGLFFGLKPAGWSRVSGARCGPRAPGCTRGPEERWAGKASSVSVPPAEGSAPEQNTWRSVERSDGVTLMFRWNSFELIWSNFVFLENSDLWHCMMLNIKGFETELACYFLNFIFIIIYEVSMN